MSNNVRDAIRTVGYMLEKHGTTGAYARNKKGLEVDPLAPAACKWCLYGAVEAVAPQFRLPIRQLVEQVANALGARSGLVSHWEGKYANLSQQETIDRLKTYGTEI